MQAANSENSATEAATGIHKPDTPHIGDEIPGSHDYNPAPHPSHLATDKGADYMAKHPVYTQEYVESIKPAHRPPQGVRSPLSRACTLRPTRACHAAVSSHDASA